MDRQTVYAGEVYADVDILQLQKDALEGLAYLSAAVLGTAGNIVGLSANPTTPGTLAVQVQPGQLYQLAQADSEAWSDLSSDSTIILQQGNSSIVLTFTITPPSSSSYAMYYLLEAQFQQQDLDLTVLPYFNNSNPPTSYATPYNGPSGSGEAQSRARLGGILFQLKAGSPAPTGNEVRPTLDSGFLPIAYVHVIYGQTSIAVTDITDARPTFLDLVTHQNESLSSGAHGGLGNINAATLGGYPASAFVLASNAGLSNVCLLSGNQTITGLDTFTEGIGSEFVYLINQSSDLSGQNNGTMWYNSTESHFNVQLPTGVASILTTEDMGSGGIINAAQLDGLTASQIESAVVSELQPQLNNTLTFTNFSINYVAHSSSGSFSTTFGFTVKQAFATIGDIQIPEGEAVNIGLYVTGTSGGTVNYDVSVASGGATQGYIVAFG